MADETETKPAIDIAHTFTERGLVPGGEKHTETYTLTPRDEPPPAAERLRAFEDEHFPEAVRIRDQIEKGSGSPFQLAKPEVRAQHHALEKLIEAETKLAAAHTALIQADTDYEAALAATEPKPDAPSE